MVYIIYGKNNRHKNKRQIPVGQKYLENWLILFVEVQIISKHSHYNRQVI
jgi:hypothetical protein